MDKNEKFEYTYSPKKQTELENIRRKYSDDPEETKMDKLRRLDKSVTRPGKAIAVALGIIGTLTMGVGMCCVMEWDIFVPGIIIGVIGMAIMGTAYPVFKAVTALRKKKIAPEILRLAEEIEQESFFGRAE